MDRVSIVIPNWNGSALLAKLLEDLQRQTYAIDRVIVVDNGSTDDSADVARRAVASLVEPRHEYRFRPCRELRHSKRGRRVDCSVKQRRIA